MFDRPMTLVRLVGATALLAGATSCAATFSSTPPSNAAGAPAPSPQTDSLPVASQVHAAPEQTGVDGYIRLALQNNPAIRAAREAAQAAAKMPDQARALEDPQLLLLPPTGAMTETAAGRVEASVGVTQRLPFPAKLVQRGRVAESQAEVANARYRSTVLDVVAGVRRAWARLYFADRAIEITTESRGLLRDLRRVAANRYAIGEVPQQDVLRAQVEIADLDGELERLAERRALAEAMIVRLIAAAPGSSLPLTGEIAIDARSAELSLLIADAERDNPEIALRQAELDAAGASLRLAKLGWSPDFSIAATYTAIGRDGLSPVADGDDVVGLGLGFTLPIWGGRIRAATTEAEHRLQAGRFALQDVRDQTSFALDGAVVALQTQRRLADLFRGVILPEASQTLAATQVAYRAGTVDFLTLIENWRRLLDLRIAYRKTLADSQEAWAVLDRLAGRSLPGIEEGS